ncbi:MAG: 3-keto-5-aminohexanoate cleavage protein [Aurantimonas endophytica]|uniref:3-keto-5-aminohexanoate cleavage protein n=1 Tax=Aurantimonas endophytica TaxID=1522175 RepID=UPI00300331D6
MTSPTIIEVALNGPWGRDIQPTMPVSVNELVADAVACARAGAAIIHLHCYDPATGKQDDNAAIYREVILRAREVVPDIAVYPTVPLAGSAMTEAAASPQARFAHVEALAKEGLIDMTVVDPGSVNFSRTKDTQIPPFVYLNPDADIVKGLQVCRNFGLRPSYAIYEPGFTRTGAQFALQMPELLTPLYRFMFSDDFSWGFPPRRYALEAHLALLNEAVPRAPWMVAGLAVELGDLIQDAVRLGGHVRVGLEDARFDCRTSNVDLVRDAAARVRAAGGEIASADAARSILAAYD